MRGLVITAIIIVKFENLYMYKLRDIYCKHILDEKLVYSANSGLKYTIGAKNDLATYCGLLIQRIIDCSNTLMNFREVYASNKYLVLLCTFSDPFQILHGANDISKYSIFILYLYLYTYSISTYMYVQIIFP